MEPKKVTLCPACTACPEVEITDRRHNRRGCEHRSAVSRRVEQTCTAREKRRAARGVRIRPPLSRSRGAQAGPRQECRTDDSRNPQGRSRWRTGAQHGRVLADSRRCRRRLWRRVVLRPALAHRFARHRQRMAGRRGMVCSAAPARALGHCRRVPCGRRRSATVATPSCRRMPIRRSRKSGDDLFSDKRLVARRGSGRARLDVCVMR
jgi:hypothetical protein